MKAHLRAAATVLAFWSFVSTLFALAFLCPVALLAAAVVVTVAAISHCIYDEILKGGRV